MLPSTRRLRVAACLFPWALAAALVAGDSAAATSNQVCLYEHARYTGRSLCIPGVPGLATAFTVPHFWKSRISSVTLPPGFEVELFGGAFPGRDRSVTLSRDTAFLGTMGFNDATTWLLLKPPLVTVASIQFAQSLLDDSEDARLMLVANKAALLKVNVTAPAGTVAPAGMVSLHNTIDGSRHDLVLDPPRRGMPAMLSQTQSLDDAYSARIPAELVKPGLQVTVTVGRAAPRSITPRVGPGIAMRFVPIPVRIGSLTGQLPPDPTAYLSALFPVSSVTLGSHPVFVPTTVTTLPGTDDEWGGAFLHLLVELETLRRLEGASGQDYYFGFVPKGDTGQIGFSVPMGNSALGFDRSDDPEEVLKNVAHELGHNFALNHAPCGGVRAWDASYPYPDATLGVPGHHVWSYRADLDVFVDPRPADRRDLMSYCGGTAFSDYSYRRMQFFLPWKAYHPVMHSPPAASGAALSSSTAAPAANAAQRKGVQEVLLISGSILGDQVALHPVKSLAARPDASLGPYVLRLQSRTGEIQDHAFRPRSTSHGGTRLLFSVQVPTLEDIARIEVLRDGTALSQVPFQAGGGRSKRSVPPAAPGEAHLTEAAGQATFRWDAVNTPFLSVTWTDGTRRVNLARDLTGGEASLATHELPAAGRFELSLSDGLNARRIELSR